MSLISDKSSLVTQSDITAGGSVIGGSQYNFNSRLSQVDALFLKLTEEMANSQHIQDMIDSLQFYHEPVAVDGINGLEAKLKHAARSDELTLALRKSECFEKLLMKYLHYNSAQEIFALFLSKIENAFDCKIKPHLGTLSKSEIDKLFYDLLVVPVANEIGANSAFSINESHIRGMIYWLAQRCYIRWHQV